MTSTTLSPPRSLTPQHLRSLVATAFHDRRLSAGARVLADLLASLGKVVPADEIWRARYMPEGRDAIRRMMRELKDLGYLTAQRKFDDEKHAWYTLQRFADEVPQVPLEDRVEYVSVAVATAGAEYDAWISGVSSTSPSSSSSTRARLGKGNTPFSQLRASLDPQPSPSETDDTPNWVQVGWDAFEAAVGSRYREATAPQGRKPRSSGKNPRSTTGKTTASPGSDPEPVPSKGEHPMLRDTRGDDIDVTDPLAAAPEPKIKIPALRPTDRRFDKPVERWSTFDLTAEFNSRAYQAGAGDIPHQINSRNLGGALGRLIAQGSRPEVLAKCVELFFDRPSSLRDMGERLPLWRRFLADVTITYGKAQKVVNGHVVTSDAYYASPEQSAAELERMLAHAESSKIREQELAESARQRDEADAQRRARRDTETAALRTNPTENWRQMQARLAEEKAVAARAEYQRLHDEIEARYAEHPDEEWIVEDEEELLIEGEEQS